ncbi:hypothetical protein BFP70_01160 [Thioclava sp. SK-1]|nr:hypothetical protein BFP70_01160 [Thioclava sp. SK-1]
MELGYPVASMAFDRSNDLWMLASDFCTDTMGLELSHSNGITELRRVTGALVMRGVLTADIPILLQHPDRGTIRLDRIEIDGSLAMYLPSEPLIPGQTYVEAQPFEAGGRAAGPEEIALMPAMATGTLIATDDGPQPIDWLRPGDRVLTRDNGYQPLLWLGQQTVPRRSPSNTRPLLIHAGQLGPDLPERDLTVTPQTGILLSGPELEMWFAENEMLAQASHVAPHADPQDGRRVVYSLLFEQPEVILAEGLWVGSVHVDSSYLTMLPDRLRASLAKRLVTQHKTAARAWLAQWETQMFTKERRASSARITA